MLYLRSNFNVCPKTDEKVKGILGDCTLSTWNVVLALLLYMCVYVFLHSGEQCLCHWIKCPVASKAAGWGEHVWLCLGPWIWKDGEGEPHSKGTDTISYNNIHICNDWNNHTCVLVITSMHNPPHKMSLMQSKYCGPEVQWFRFQTFILQTQFGSTSDLQTWFWGLKLIRIEFEGQKFEIKVIAFLGHHSNTIIITMNASMRYTETVPHC